MMLIEVLKTYYEQTYRSGWFSKKMPNRSQASRSYLETMLSKPSGAIQRVPSPVSTTEDLDCTRYRVCLTSVRFDADPTTVLDAEQMVYDFESLFSLRIVCAADVHNLLELTLRVVAEECKDGYNGRRRDVQGQFVFEDGELLNEFRETLQEVRAIGV